MGVKSEVLGWKCEGCGIHRNSANEVWRDCVCKVEYMKELVEPINEAYWNHFWKRKQGVDVHGKVHYDGSERAKE